MNIMLLDLPKKRSCVGLSCIRFKLWTRECCAMTSSSLGSSSSGSVGWTTGAPVEEEAMAEAATGVRYATAFPPDFSAALRSVIQASLSKWPPNSCEKSASGQSYTAQGLTATSIGSSCNLPCLRVFPSSPVASRGFLHI